METHYEIQFWKVNFHVGSVDLLSNNQAGGPTVHQ